jgi:Aminoglycoside adenylyltransferase, C-terminal domain
LALNWHSVVTCGETIVGPLPSEIGPEITAGAFRRAIERQLDGWKDDVRASWVAYVPAHQGYIVVTVCRALYGLATGELTTKDNAVAWAAERFPDRADFVTEALEQYRADVAEPHRATIEFVEFALTKAERLESR